MKKTIDETNYRRNKQKEYNIRNKIIPKPINKIVSDIFESRQIENTYKDQETLEIDFKNMTKETKEKEINKYRKQMEKAAKSLDFIEAAKFRDIIRKLKE